MWRIESESPEYRSWSSMKTRCLNTRMPDYHNYGGRGIEICWRWRYSYKLFLEDMGRRPTPGHSLDRIDANGHYEPDNCRWATWIEQQRNRRDCVFLVIDGQRATISEWAERRGLSYKAVYQRLQSGWSPQRALSVPVQKRSGKRLNASQREEIKAAWTPGVRLRDHGARFGVSAQTVSDILGGRGRGRNTSASRWRCLAAEEDVELGVQGAA